MSLAIPIVMYHYVRDLSLSRFPQIKGLDIRQFRNQLNFFRKNYTVVHHDQVCAHIFDGEDLPKNAIMLSFDDGYADHYQFVFPILDDFKMSACFFPPVQAILEHRVLDVNKIHFILASTDDHKSLLQSAFDWVGKNSTIDLAKIKGEYFVPNRYDGPEVNCFKRLLQKCLPLELRQMLVDILFKQYVSKDEKSFAAELYLSVDQLKCMQRNGMTIGSHGYSHCWMDTLPKEEQESEVLESIKFLSLLGVSKERWSICYPYGAHNQSLREIAFAHGAQLGFTTVPEPALLTRENALMLSRLDTNDFPKD